MTVDLPYDVLHVVIEMLTKEEPADFATVQSISQTCRYLLPTCRKHMFSSIWLQTRVHGSDVVNPAYEKRGLTRHIGVKNMAKLIARTPAIARYVREFYFYPHPSNYVDDELLRLLQKFHRLEKLHIGHIRGTEIRTRFQDWNTLVDSLRTAVLTLVHQQRYTLTHLFVTDYLNIPTSIIYPLTCLHTFHLIDSTVFSAFVSDPLIICHPHPLQLKFLTFTMGYGAIYALLEGVRQSSGLPFFDLSQLQIFSASISSDASGTVDEGIPISRLLRRMRQLQALDISVQAHWFPVNLPNVFNSIQSVASEKLETLCFRIWYASNYDPSLHQLPAAILRDTRPFRSLNQIGITLCIFFPIPDNSPAIEDFIELDNLLSTPKFSSLKSLYLFLSFFGVNSDGGDLEPWLNIPALMPRCSTNPALEFVFLPQKFSMTST